MELIFIVAIVTFVYAYRKNDGKSAYKYITKTVGAFYDKYAPYSFKSIREKVKQLGLEYTPRQYTIQLVIFSIVSFGISYLYFYSIFASIIYVSITIAIIPYLAYLRCKKVFSEFIFEQIQVYTTNVIMEFATTQSFVSSLEGVYASGVLEDPVQEDVKTMIDLAYENGDISTAIEFFNEKYDYYIVKNMHQLFYQITSEGSTSTGEALDNMLLDIDMLVENVYRDRIDRSTFHKSFITYAILLYLLVMLMQLLLGVESYLKLLESFFTIILLNAIIIINSIFLLGGEKYYYENVGAE